MSERQVVAIMRAVLKDDTDGLAAAMLTIASAESLDAIDTAIYFPKWISAGTFQPGFSSVVTVVPFRSESDVRDVDARPVQRDGNVMVRITYEIQLADQSALEDNVLVAAAALRGVLDSLTIYSDSNSGTVQGVVSPMAFEFGTFESDQNGSAGGFVCTVTILERGTE